MAGINNDSSPSQGLIEPVFIQLPQENEGGRIVRSEAEGSSVQLKGNLESAIYPGRNSGSSPFWQGAMIAGGPLLQLRTVQLMLNQENAEARASQPKRVGVTRKRAGLFAREIASNLKLLVFVQAATPSAEVQLWLSGESRGGARA
jgi:hypothetical protein